MCFYVLFYLSLMPVLHPQDFAGPYLPSVPLLLPSGHSATMMQPLLPIRAQLMKETLQTVAVTQKTTRVTQAWKRADPEREKRVPNVETAVREVKVCWEMTKEENKKVRNMMAHIHRRRNTYSTLLRWQKHQTRTR